MLLHSARTFEVYTDYHLLTIFQWQVQLQFYISRVADGICYVHEESTAAIVQLLQMQLLNLYPKYRFWIPYFYFSVNFKYLISFQIVLKCCIICICSTTGYEALYSCPPVVYISNLCIPSLGNVICRKLGFPSSCVKTVKMSGSKLIQLEKSLQEDLAAKRVPVMIIACCGSHHTGMVDNLVAVSQLAQRFSCWLHLEGHLISHLCLSDQPKKV